MWGIVVVVVGVVVVVVIVVVVGVVGVRLRLTCKKQGTKVYISIERTQFDLILYLRQEGDVTKQALE